MGQPATELLLLPSLRAQQLPNGRLVMTRKYWSGAARYEAEWPGPVTSLVETSLEGTHDMDRIEFGKDDLGSRLELRPTNPKALANRLQNAAAVLAHLSRREAPLASLCHRLGVPLIYNSEYSLRTEQQILAAEVPNRLLRWRRQLWAARTERIRLAALRLAAGIQCSGTPTYEVYRHHSPRPMLFFDNRVPQAEVISPDALERRLATLAQDRPLRLIFGGRLVPMKGVRDLPPLAAALRARGIDFEFCVHGSGPLAEELSAAATKLQLGSHFRLGGALDFATGWIPLLQRQADLFVCCHPQGDPSSTYPEVMSCGVPIAGYDNEAFAGIARASDSGFPTPLGQIDALADCIAKLDRNRGAIAAAARKARAFALLHAFEPAYSRRVAHLRECAAAGGRDPAVASTTV
jgi:colanic acid/amylovoran biosynthesis glycosyltransferase